MERAGEVWVRWFLLEGEVFIFLLPPGHKGIKDRASEGDEMQISKSGRGRQAHGQIVTRWMCSIIIILTRPNYRYKVLSIFSLSNQVLFNEAAHARRVP
jgi:hypothetical protein